MKRPGILTRLIGHPLIVIPVWLLGGYGLWQWWQGKATVTVAILAFFAMAVSGNANGHMSDYHAWKRAWDGLAGKPQRRLYLPALPTPLKRMLAVALWCAITYWGVQHAQAPTIAAAMVLFYLATVLALLLWAVRAARRWWARHRAARDRDKQIVALCLPVPKESPTLAQARAALSQFAPGPVSPSRP